MISLETFLLLLMVVSVLTGLCTEAIKKMMKELGKTYKSNILAGAVASVLSVIIGTGYIVLMEVQFNDKMAVILIALVLLSWLSAMVGYDKVLQAITQIKASEQ